MGILPDWMINRDVKIEPRAEGVSRPDTISYGTTSYGYDARIGCKFKVFSPIGAKEIDPKNFNPAMCVDVHLAPDEYILIPPHSFALGETLEWFDIPRDCLAIVLGKSTYARCGLIVNVTPLEPEWKGKVTVELSNTTPLPLRVYAGEGIMQILFLRTDGYQEAVRRIMEEKLRYSDHGLYAELVRMLNSHSTCERSYADKKGKYQNQEGLVLPKVDKGAT